MMSQLAFFGNQHCVQFHRVGYRLGAVSLAGVFSRSCAHQPNGLATAPNIAWWLAVAALEQELRAGLEGSLARHEELKGIGQAIHGVEGEADRERVPNLGARDTGSQRRAYVVRIHGVLAR